MKVYEAVEYLGSLQYKDKTGWEQTRQLAYVAAQVNSTKKITPQEVMRLPWDDEVKPVEVTDEDRERLTQKAQEVKKLLKNG